MSVFVVGSGLVTKNHQVQKMWDRKHVLITISFGPLKYKCTKINSEAFSDVPQTIASPKITHHMACTGQNHYNIKLTKILYTFTVHVCAHTCTYTYVIVHVHITFNTLFSYRITGMTNLLRHLANLAVAINSFSFTASLTLKSTHTHTHTHTHIHVHTHTKKQDHYTCQWSQ